MLILFSFEFKSFEITTLRDSFISLFPFYPFHSHVQKYSLGDFILNKLSPESFWSNVLRDLATFVHVLLPDLTLRMIRTILTPYFLNVFWQSWFGPFEDSQPAFEYIRILTKALFPSFYVSRTLVFRWT